MSSSSSSSKTIFSNGSTLQEHLNALLEERGYCADSNTPLINTLETAYYSKATAWQTASYGAHMIQMVKKGQVETLRDTLLFDDGHHGDGSWLLTANMCNGFGESLLHMACRRGNLQMLKVFLQAGANLQVCDDYGKTPLHDACWSATPAFDVVKEILQRDSYLLFMKDRRGALPLSYVQKSDVPAWKEWLTANIDTFFPADGAATYGPSDLCSMEPNSFPILPTVFKVTNESALDIVKQVANGTLDPKEAHIFNNISADDDEVTVAETVATEDYDSDEYDSDDFDSDYENDSDFGDMDQEEMMHMLGMAQVARQSSSIAY